MVVTGEQSAYTRRYCTANAANCPSAPIMAISHGAAAYITAPIRMPVVKIIRQAQVKMLLACLSRPCPSAMEIGTAEPTPMRSASEKLMNTNGNARFSAAKAVPSRNWPTRMPSARPYSDDANMPMAPGSAAIKNSFAGGVFKNIVCWSIKISYPPG